MQILVILFGGTDHQILRELDCKYLKQAEWNPLVVDELRNQRDVATQITAQLLTGKTWRENGIGDRRKRIFQYRAGWAKFVEQKIFREMPKGKWRRSHIYQALRAVHDVSREFMKEDIKCPTLFDVIPNSRAVYVPAYNPEPSWALTRNILDPRKYPEMGFEGAIDLREKNFEWRKKALFQALDEDPYDLLMAQFQYIDSTQHLFMVYADPPRMDYVEQAYKKIDDFAGEIIRRAEGKYDRIIFLSDNGAARKEEWRPTHYNRPFYSLSWPEGLENPNLRDFFHHIVHWVNMPLNSGVAHESRL